MVYNYEMDAFILKMKYCGVTGMLTGKYGGIHEVQKIWKRKNYHEMNHAMVE